MVVIRTLGPDEAVVLAGGRVRGHSHRGLWEAWLREGTLLGVVVEQDRVAVGFAVAESHPQVLHVVRLEGDTETCLLLVERLVRLSGERDVSVWCPVARPDVQQILEGMGFARLVRDAFLGRPSNLYRWKREDD